MRRLVDSHCHVHDDVALQQHIHGAGVGVLALMGVQPSNWDLLDSALAQGAGRDADGEQVHLIPCYGMHPWFAHEHLAEDGGTGEEQEPQWCASLRERLLARPHAAVGEIGLDKAARSRGGGGTRTEMWKGQMQALLLQMDLAAELDRPVSMHCVKATGVLFECVRKAAKEQRPLPPAIALHSYGGSPDMIKAFSKLKGVGGRFYFGFSSAINVRNNGIDAVIANMRECPEDRILLETDIDDPGEVDVLLPEIYQVLADAKGWSVHDTVERVEANCRRFFGHCWPDALS